MLPREGPVPARRRQEDALPRLRLGASGSLASALLAVAAGAASWAAHPPAGWWPTSFLVVPLLLTAVRALPAGDRGLRRPFLLGLFAGYVTFLPMIPWLIQPAGYLAWVALSTTQALWYGAVTAFLARWNRSWWLLLAAPAGWTAIEVLRNQLPLSGFGWGAISYAHAEGSPLLPLARVIGGSGLTFLTVLVGVALLEAGRRILADRRAGVTVPGLVGVAAVLAVPVGAVLAPRAPAEVGTVDVLAVQGNDLPDFAGSALEEDLAIADNLLAETQVSVAEHGVPDLTVWPESSLDTDPFSDRGASLLPYLEEASALVDGGFLVGANIDGERPRTFQNSALLVDASGDVVDRYVKRSYVPFGEYVPFRSLIGDIGPLRQIPRDGIPGPGPQTVESEGVDAAVVICFETLFPEVVRSNVRAGGAGIVVAITNDASFGRSWESDQHIAQSRLRAVETGRWVVHAALSGRSALIDPNGRVHERTGIFVRDTIRDDVPVVEGETTFLVLGDVVGQAAVWLSLALVLVPFVARRATRHQQEQG